MLTKLIYFLQKRHNGSHSLTLSLDSYSALGLLSLNLFFLYTSLYRSIRKLIIYIYSILTPHIIYIMNRQKTMYRENVLTCRYYTSTHENGPMRRLKIASPIQRINRAVGADRRMIYLISLRRYIS